MSYQRLPVIDWMLALNQSDVNSGLSGNGLTLAALCIQLRISG